MDAKEDGKISSSQNQKKTARRGGKKEERKIPLLEKAEAAALEGRRKYIENPAEL